MSVTHVTLLNNVAATGEQKQFAGGKAQVCVIGTFGGASLQLQMMGPNGSTWVAVGSAITAAGVATHDLPNGNYRMTVTGGTPSGLYAALARVPQG